MHQPLQAQSSKRSERTYVHPRFRSKRKKQGKQQKKKPSSRKKIHCWRNRRNLQKNWKRRMPRFNISLKKYVVFIVLRADMSKKFSSYRIWRATGQFFNWSKSVVLCSMKIWRRNSTLTSRKCSSQPRRRRRNWRSWGNCRISCEFARIWWLQHPLLFVETSNQLSTRWIAGNQYSSPETSWRVGCSCNRRSERLWNCRSPAWKTCSKKNRRFADSLSLTRWEAFTAQTRCSTIAQMDISSSHVLFHSLWMFVFQLESQQKILRSEFEDLKERYVLFDSGCMIVGGLVKFSVVGVATK